LSASTSISHKYPDDVVDVEQMQSASTYLAYSGYRPTSSCACHASAIRVYSFKAACGTVVTR